MFSIKELRKLKQELLKSLIVEADTLLNQIPKQIKKKSEVVLKAYIKTSSIAGLELWVNGVSEYLYFSEAKKELSEVKSGYKELKDFQSALAENLKLDFGVEDFRFLEWERAKPQHSMLEKILNRLVSQALHTCTVIEPKLYLNSKSDFLFFEKANGDPSLKTVKIKTIKKKTPQDKINQIQLAHEYLEVFWPEGFALYESLTDKVHIVQSNGLVSYSHFQEQGISYINFIDRDILESIDDLVHENSHHHLNLLLKKYKFFKKELKDEIFYSPWRKSLRSLYAILHATFTFSYGALLFYNITKSKAWVFIDLEESYKQRAYFRFVEETLSVDYSLFDLNWAVKNGYFTVKGEGLVKKLSDYNQECKSIIPEIKKHISSKEAKLKIKSLQEILEFSREKFKIY